jgi:hypothetical protein
MASIIPVNPVPLPLGDPIASSRKAFSGFNLRDVTEYLKSQDSQGFLTQTWQRFFSQIQQTISASPTRIDISSLTGQSANIGATDVSGSNAAAGVYGIHVYARITTPATTGAATSSLTVTIGWTDGGVTQSHSFAALTGNSVTTVLTNPSLTIRSDASSPITYATTYASDTAGQMQYSLDVALLRVAA